MALREQDISSMLAEFKSLPKRDQKAITRQLSGQDKLKLKKAAGYQPVTGKEEFSSVAMPDVSRLSPWLSKRISQMLECTDPSENLGIGASVLAAMPAAIAAVNAMSDTDGKKPQAVQTISSFKAVLARLQRSAT